MGRVLWQLAAAIALAAVVAVPVVFDPVILADVSGLNGTVDAKHALLRFSGFIALGLALLAAAASGQRRLRFAPSDLPLALLLVYAAFTLRFAPDVPDGLASLFSLSAAVILGVFARTLAADEGPGRILRFCVGGAFVAGVVDFAVRMIHGGPVMVQGSEKFSHLFAHDNVAALLFAPLAALVGAWAWMSTGRVRVIGAAFALFFVAIVALLKSKAGLIAVVFGPLAFVGAGYTWRNVLSRFARSKAQGAAVTAVVGIGFAGLVLLPAQPKVSAFLKEQFNRVVTTAGINYDAAYMRPKMWHSIFKMVEDHPQGVGIGNFTVQLPPYDQEIATRPHAHDQFLQVLAETGLPGLLLFLVFVALVLARMLDRAFPQVRDAPAGRRADEPSNDRGLDLGIGAAFFVMLFQGVFETPLQFPFTALLWFTLAGVGTRAAGARPLASALGVAARSACGVVGIAALGLACFTALAPIVQFERFRAGLKEIANGRPARGIELFERALATGFDNYPARGQLAQLYSASGDFDRALVHADRAVELCPYDHELHKLRGLCLARLKRTDEALESYDRVDRLKRESRTTGYLRGEALVLGGRYDDAIKSMEAYRETVSESPPLLLLLGNAYYARWEKTQSRADAAKAEELYSRFVAMGGNQKGDWVNERIRQLGHERQK